jgi:hypothetical protein
LTDDEQPSNLRPLEDGHLGLLSPTKKSGILVTPGTERTRKKTVSFCGNTKDVEEPNHALRSGLPQDFPGKFPSPWSTRSSKNQPDNEINAHIVEAAPGQLQPHRTPDTIPNSINIEGDDKNRPSSAQRTEAFRRSLAISKGIVDASETDAPIKQDSTKTEMSIEQEFKPNDDTKREMDWKVEFEKLARKSAKDLKRSADHKQMITTFARKKDSEAIELSERLRKERVKVSKLEERIRELVADLERSHMEANTKSKDAKSTTDLVSQPGNIEVELAVLEKKLSREGETSGNSKIPAKFHKHHNAADEQQRELHTLRTDVKGLNQLLSQSEEQLVGMENENKHLMEELLRAKEYTQRQEAKLTSRTRSFDEAEASFSQQKEQFKERIDRLKLSNSELVERLQLSNSKLESEIRSMKNNQSRCDGNCPATLRLRLQLDETKAAHLASTEKLQTQIKQINRDPGNHFDPAPSATARELEQQRKSLLDELKRTREESSDLRIQNTRLQAELAETRLKLNQSKKPTSRASKENLSPSLFDKPTKLRSKDSSFLIHSTGSFDRTNKSAQTAITGNDALIDLDINDSFADRLPALSSLIKLSPERPHSTPPRLSAYNTSDLSLDLPQPSPETDWLGVPRDSFVYSQQVTPSRLGGRSNRHVTATNSVTQLGSGFTPLQGSAERRLSRRPVSGSRKKASIPAHRIAAAKARVAERAAEKRKEQMHIG